jgi:hypothetical protein
MPARHARRDILTESIRGIDVKRGTAGELNRVLGLKFMKLFKKRLPDIGNGHLTSNFDFHVNNLKQSIILNGAYTYSLTIFGTVMQISITAFRRCSK